MSSHDTFQSTMIGLKQTYGIKNVSLRVPIKNFLGITVYRLARVVFFGCQFMLIDPLILSSDCIIQIIPYSNIPISME